MRLSNSVKLLSAYNHFISIKGSRECQSIHSLDLFYLNSFVKQIFAICFLHSQYFN